VAFPASKAETEQTVIKIESNDTLFRASIKYAAQEEVVISGDLYARCADCRSESVRQLPADVQMSFRDDPYLFFSMLVLSLLIVFPGGSDCRTDDTVVEAHAQEAAKSAGPSDSPDLARRLAAIERTAEEIRQKQSVPGMAVAIVKNGDVVFTKGFGLRDVDGHKPVTPNTLFRIGSDTKAFTAMVTVMSQDDGKLSLDDSPKKYLHYFKLQDRQANSKATIRDLLCHRTGLGRTDNIELTGVLTRPEMIRVIGLAKPIATFRERFIYNNAMFTVAGEVVAKAQHATWDKVIIERILMPLGMDSTDLSIAEMQRSPDFAYGYQYFAGTKETKQLPPTDLDAIAPAGAINSNATDMAKWLRFMLARGTWNGKSLVSEAGYTQLTTVQMHVAANVDYGLGWYLTTWKGHKVVVHGGDTRGFTAEVAFMPDKNLGVVVLTNQDDSAITKQIRDNIWANLVDEPLDPAAANGNQATSSAGKPESDVPLGAASFQPSQEELLGRYQSALATASSEIAVKNDRLVYINSQKTIFPMTSKGKDAFSLAGLADVSIEIVRDKNGRANTIVIAQPSGSVELDRVGAFIPDITVDELMHKLIEATGGETNIKRHTTMKQTVAIDFETLGVKGEAVIVSKTPDLWASHITRYALGKRIDASFSYFDGTAGGGDGYKLSGTDLDDERIDDEFYGLRDWRTLFKSVEIKNKKRVGAEEAYLVVATPETGSRVAYYISAKTFLLLKRERRGADISLFEDYKKVAGEMVPFKTTYITPGGQRNVYRVKDIRFDTAVSDAEFSSAGK
jgi:CubicO group peptidase (beta-lactamase class C family)